MKHGNTLRILLALSLAAIACSGAPASAAADKFIATAVTEKKVRQLPGGTLYWRLENFPSLSQAESAAGTTSLAAEVGGRAWLFTLGPKGGSTPGGSKVAEVGPVPAFSAPEYL